MPHLLLDLAKLKKCKKIPYKHAKVGLLVTSKQARKLITPEEPHAVYVLPEKKAANSIVQAALDILNAHPDSHLTIVSPRTKVQAAITNIQRDYPQAQVACFDKLGKKVKTHLQTKSITRPENHVEHETENCEAEEQFVQEHMARSKDNATVFTLLEQEQQNQADADNQADREIQAALMLFKKNRPKKKTDLVRLLSDSQRSDVSNIHDLVVKLQQEGHIHIDAAENVRYDF